MPKKLSKKKAFIIKHKSTGRVMRIEKTPNHVLLYKQNFVYKVKKEGNRYIKVRIGAGKEIVEEMTKTEMRKFGAKLQKFLPN